MAMRQFTVRFFRTLLINLLVQSVLIPAYRLYELFQLYLMEKIGERWYCAPILFALCAVVYFGPATVGNLLRKGSDYGKIRAACRRGGYQMEGGLFPFLFSREGKEALRIRRGETTLSVYVMGGLFRAKKYRIRADGSYEVRTIHPFVAKFFREGDYDADEAAETRVYRLTRLLFMSRAKEGKLPRGEGEGNLCKILLFTPRSMLAKLEGETVTEGNRIREYEVYETKTFLRGQLSLHAAQNEREDRAAHYGAA